MRNIITAMCLAALFGCGDDSKAGGSVGIDDPLIARNLSELNRYRREANIAPVELDEQLSQFANEATKALSETESAHAYFGAHARESKIPCRPEKENQGWGTSSTPMNLIDGVLQDMINEGPGGGHHDTMLDPAMKSVGIGIVVKNGGMTYMTNDFSSCR